VRGVSCVRSIEAARATTATLGLKLYPDCAARQVGLATLRDRLHAHGKLVTVYVSMALNVCHAWRHVRASNMHSAL
jgi:hypothetical protein